MDKLLTLVIALGGIATGVGAIWAALAARRQGQISERQAQITEGSLAQTERSLAEQNERARLTLEYDLLTRMRERFESPQLRSSRRATAKYFLENTFVDDEVVEAPSMANDAVEVCNFFEELGEMVRLGILGAESVTSRFSVHGQAYWTLCRPAIEKFREEWELSTIYEEFEYLSRLMADLDPEQGAAPRRPEVLRQVMEWESVVGEEPSTMTE
jgi:hypothetical protein